MCALFPFSHIYLSVSFFLDINYKLRYPPIAEFYRCGMSKLIRVVV